MIILKPNLFLRFNNKIRNVAALIMVLSFIISAYFIIIAPLDYQMLDSVRIMYVHVPSAWLSLNLYFSMGAMAIGYLAWKNPLIPIISYTLAKIGFGYSIIALVTGSIWGKPMWGAYWVWDPRLTSTLILSLFYLAYIVYVNESKNYEKSKTFAAIIAIIGSINVPIVKLSVEMWNTLHQPSSILRKNGIAIDKEMLIPLFLVFFSCISFIIFITFSEVRANLLFQKKINKIS